MGLGSFYIHSFIIPPSILPVTIVKFLNLYGYFLEDHSFKQYFIMSIYTPPPFPHPTRQAPSPPPFSVHTTPSHETLTTISRDSDAKLLAVRYSDNTAGRAPYTERSAWDRDDDEKSERNQCCGMRKRKSWLLLLVIVGVAVAIAVGAGVGVSMMQKARSSAERFVALIPRGGYEVLTGS